MNRMFLPGASECARTYLLHTSNIHGVSRRQRFAARSCLPRVFGPFHAAIVAASSIVIPFASLTRSAPASSGIGFQPAK
jgi:hypothetical protein